MTKKSQGAPKNSKPPATKTKSRRNKSTQSSPPPKGDGPERTAKREHGAQESTVPPQRPWLLIAVVLVLGLLLVGTWLSNLWDSSATTDNAAASMAAGFNAVDQEAEARTAEAQKKQAELQEKRVLSRTSLLQLQKRIEHGRSALDALEQEVQRWRQDILPLRANDRGQYLAANEKNVVTYFSVIESPRPGDAELVAFRESLDSYHEHVKPYLDAEGSTYVPTRELKEQVDALVTRIEDAKVRYREDRETILALLAEAESAGRKPADSLAEARDALEQRDAKERAAAIARRQAAIDDEMEDDFLRLQAEAHRAKKEKELAEESLRAEQEKAKAAQAQAELERAKREAESESRKALAQDATVQANYEPFLARGIYFPVSGPRWDYTNGTEPGPVSYSRLLDSKSLDTFEDFVELATNYKNDRPRWPEAKTEEEWAEYRRRYEEFKKLAPIWVELGVLKP